MKTATYELVRVNNPAVTGYYILRLADNFATYIDTGTEGEETADWLETLSPEEFDAYAEGLEFHA